MGATRATDVDLVSRKVIAGHLAPVIALLSGGEANVLISNPGDIYASGLVSGALDAFGRQRVSNPEAVFDSQLEYSDMPLYWDSILTGGGSATFLPNTSSVRLRVNTASGDKSVRQTSRYYRYRPGKSQRILLTGVMGSPKSNVRQRLGYFDDRNGVFFEQTSSGLSVVVRSYVTGSAVDTKIQQSDWNIDKLDGTGASGITIDVSRAQIFIMDLKWLGVGTVRYGFVIDGAIVYCHAAHHANSIYGVYMSTANLPIRYEIENTGVSDSLTDMVQICSEIASEGGTSEKAQIFSVSNENTLRSVSTTFLPILSVRVSTVFPAGGSLLNRVTSIPIEVTIFTEDYPAYFKVLYNPASLTNASWQNFDTTHSGMQYDVSATAVSGGVQVGAGYVAAGRNVAAGAELSIAGDIALTLDAAGSTGDILTIAAIRVGTNDTDMGAAITWKELY